jgi:hypothetical protein
VIGALGLLLLVVAGTALAEDHVRARDHLRSQINTTARTDTTITIDGARTLADDWAVDNGFDGVASGEAIEFTRHFYVVMVDDASGEPAFELIVCRDGRYVHPAQTAVWNTAYDLPAVDMGAMMQSMGSGSDMMTMMREHHGDGVGHGMMNGTGPMHDPGQMQQQSGSRHGSHHNGSMPNGMGAMSGMMDGDMPMLNGGDCPFNMTSAEPLDETLTVAGAADIARTWLDGNDAGAVVGDAWEFPGYVTFQVVRDGTTTGLVSVQFSTGSVFGHLGHGDVLSADLD